MGSVVIRTHQHLLLLHRNRDSRFSCINPFPQETSFEAVNWLPVKSLSQEDRC